MIKEWKSMGIRGWLDAGQPWFYFAETLGQKAAELVGAKPEEVVATGSTTINLHALISTFFKPDSGRNQILADELNFPSDIYAFKGQLKLRGWTPADHLIMVPSPEGKTLREADIVDLMSEKIGLILLSSVLFRSGQLLDMPLLTSEAHKRGIPIGFDCSHSVGAIPHYFDQWDIDFAVWCSYKYMNGGPGSPAFLYVNQRHFRKNHCWPAGLAISKKSSLIFPWISRPAPTPAAGRFLPCDPGCRGHRGRVDHNVRGGNPEYSP